MEVTSVKPESLVTKSQDTDFFLVDVRTPLEFAAFRATRAVNFPLSSLNPEEIRAAAPTVDQPVYVICRSGKRAEMACKQLLKAGFENVRNVTGGTLGWDAAGLPVERSASRFTLSLEQQVRLVIGAIVAVGAGFALLDPWFALIPLVMGLGLVFAGITDSCLMAMMVSRLPWNQRVGPRTVCTVHPTRQACE